MKSFRKVPKIWVATTGGLLLGLLLGLLIVLAIRFLTYDAGYVHYHANFGVYIDGQREEFKGPTYYEEVTACKAGDELTPEDRAHMHDNVNDIAHVHDHAVTWGQFFENLGWAVGKDFIATRDNLYQNNDKRVLYIILNDQDLTGISSITNRVVGDEDKLLLSFGDLSQSELQQEYNAISTTAHEHNQKPDPASCAGPSETTVYDRLKNLF